jgi:hypothetical protein
MFTLITRTLSRNATLGLIAALPGTVVMVFGFFMIVNSGGAWELADRYLTERGMSMFWGILLLIGGFGLLVIADLWCSLASIRVVRREMDGEFISAGNAIADTWKHFWSGLGFSVIEVLIFIGILLAALLIAALIAAPWSESVGATIVIIVLILAAIPIVYLSVSWILALNAIVIDGAGPVSAFSKSSELVKGVWWKVLLFVIAAAAFQLLISNGVTELLSLLGAFEIHGFERLDVTDTDTLFETAEMMSGLFERIIGMGLSMFLAMLVAPVYSTVLYVVRKETKTTEHSVEESAENIDTSDNKTVQPE